MSTLIRRIFETKKNDVARAKEARPLKDLQRMIKDAPKLLPFKACLDSSEFGIIGEIKKKSPSRADMIPANVEEAPEVYRDTRLVKAVSILTDWTYFGMTVEGMLRYKERIGKPVLRKDFIFDEYQVWEARAFGADAILVMSCLPITKPQLRALLEIATELGMDVLFEVHSEREIWRVPNKASLFGINSRTFMTSRDSLRYKLSKLTAKFFPGNVRDFSTDVALFEKLIGALPKGSIKVAESGVTPSQISKIRNVGFDAALIGTALLQSSKGVRLTLNDFAEQLTPATLTEHRPRFAPA